jgi:hypothetical protein
MLSRPLLLLVTLALCLGGCRSCGRRASLPAPAFEGVRRMHRGERTFEDLAALAVPGCWLQDGSHRALLALIHPRQEPPPVPDNPDIAVIIRLSGEQQPGRHRCAVGSGCEVRFTGVNLVWRAVPTDAGGPGGGGDLCELDSLAQHHLSELQLFPALSGIVDLATDAAGVERLSFDVTFATSLPDLTVQVGAKALPLHRAAKTYAICRGCWSSPRPPQDASSADQPVRICVPHGYQLPCSSVRARSGDRPPARPRASDASRP